MIKFLSVVLALCAYASAGTMEDVAKAIAKAEGFGRPGTIPSRYHNPGDLKAARGHFFPGQIGIGKGGHAIFRSNEAGLAALVGQLNRILEGRSKYYRPNVTIQQMARKYAGDWRHWSKNVAHNLGVTENTSLYEYLGRPPYIQFVPQPFALDLGGAHGEVGAVEGPTLVREIAPSEDGQRTAGAGCPCVYDDHREGGQPVQQVLGDSFVGTLERWLVQTSAEVDR